MHREFACTDYGFALHPLLLASAGLRSGGIGPGPRALQVAVKPRQPGRVMKSVAAEQTSACGRQRQGPKAQTIACVGGHKA